MIGRTQGGKCIRDYKRLLEEEGDVVVIIRSHYWRHSLSQPQHNTYLRHPGARILILDTRSRSQGKLL